MSRNPSLFSRLRVRLLLLILLVLLPALMLTVYTAQVQISLAHRSAQVEALRLAQVAATNQEELVNSAEQLLIALAQVDVVINGDIAACNRLFNGLREIYQRYTNIFLVETRGDLVCTGRPDVPVGNVGDQQWFMEAKNLRGFTVSDYALGTISKRPVVTYAYPVFDKNNNIQYLVAVSLDLAWVSQLVDNTRFPPNTIVTALDRNGVVLYTYPENDAYIGTPYPDTTLLQTINQLKTGSAEGADLAGQQRLFGYTQLDGQNGSAIILVGMALDVAYAENNRLLTQNLIVLTLVGVVMLVVAWYGTNVLLVRQVNELVSKARRLAEGDLGARVDLNQVRNTYELMELSRTFNEMAEASEYRQNELERARDNSELRVKMRTKELAFLVESGNVLASSLDYHQALQKTARLTIPQLADSCLIHVMENGEYQQVAFACYDRVKQAKAETIFERFAMWKNGLPKSVRDGKPVMYNENLDELLKEIAQNTGHAEQLRSLGIHAVMLIPLMLRGNISGVIMLMFTETNRRYEYHHWIVCVELARQAAVAVENARLYQEAWLQQREISKLNSELEQRVLQRTEQLTAVNKELEAFSYSVSHDLRTPLRAIDGFSQALIEDHADKLDDEGINYLSRVRSATQRMGMLIDDLLHLSRVTRTEMDHTPVDLSKMAHEVITELCESESTRNVETDIQEGLIVSGDERMLRILMQNLLGNAWKFSNKREMAKIEFGITQCDGQAAYFVRDNGAGFDMSYANKLFGAFQRLHRPEEFDGTGIGLATVQRIIHRHGGQIWANSEVDKGATFYFTFGENRLN